MCANLVSGHTEAFGQLSRKILLFTHISNEPHLREKQDIL